ncbi:MAG TPA: CPBP family intramembrane glutamic endopeptidase [Nitrososphaera sp.]
MAGNFADERADMNPRAWLSRYRRTSISYLIKMLLFYHGLGLGLLLLGNAIIDQVLPEHEEPSIPRSLSGVLAAGPLEETVFFGIPFYVFGNAYSVLVTGALWVGIHLFNTDTISINSLAFGNLLFVLPSLFFSLRTWVSGKGWFSIVTHSAWNGIFFAAGCSAGEFECTLVDPDMGTNVLTMGLSVALLVGTYVLYKKRGGKKWQQEPNEFNI